MKSGRPVKIELNRREDIATTRTRHAIITQLKTGVNKDGTIVAQDYRIIANAGAYATGSSSIVWAMCSKVFRIFKAPNIRFVGLPVYTNTQPAGAMRGFGSPQQTFAQQCQLARIAKKLGMSQLELLRKNLVQRGDEDLRCGFPLGNPRPLDCVEKGAELFGWEAALQQQAKPQTGRYRVGVGMAAAVHGNGVYGVRPDTSGITLKMNDDGTVVLFTGNHEMGNGVVTTQCMAVAEVLGFALENIAVIQADTDATLSHFGDFSSRGTFVCVQGAQKCAEKLAHLLRACAAELLDCKTAHVTLSGGAAHAPDGVQASFGEVVAHAQRNYQTDLIASHTYAAEACASSYGAHFAKVQVDTETGEVQVLDYVAVHDVGRPLNPLNLEGQVEGAVHMGLGHAFSEDAGVDEKGAVKNANFRRYRLFQSSQMPLAIRTAFLNSEEPFGPFGAKSIGECAVVPCIATLANAVSAALGVEITRLPMHPAALKQAFANR